MPKSHFSKFFSATLISRGFGYLRDLAIAHFVGGGALADLYFASFRLSNFLRGLLGEGGLYAAYTPLYSSILKKDKKDSTKFAYAYLGRLALILILVVTLGIASARYWTPVLLLGFGNDPQRMGLAITLNKILLPFLLFVALAAWAQATLQANGKFFWSSLSPIFLSISIIIYLFAAQSRAQHSESLYIIGLAWATIAGGFLQFLVQWPQLAAAIGQPGLKDLGQSHPDLKRALFLFGPYLFTFSLDQTNMLVGTFFGSFTQTGTIAALYNSSRLVQLPLGLIGVGSLVTTLPELSQKVSDGNRFAVISTIKAQIKRVLMLEIPILAFFLLFAPQVIRVLYFHGAFSAQAFELTSMLLRMTAPTLLFFSLQKVYLSLFYAHQDTQSLLWVSFAQLTSNAALCALLIGAWGASGIGLAASISSGLGLGALYCVAKKKNYA